MELGQDVSGVVVGSNVVETWGGECRIQMWSKPGRESGGFNFGQNLGGKVGDSILVKTWAGKWGIQIWSKPGRESGGSKFG